MPAYDVNKDGITNILDLILVGQAFGKAKPANARTDVNSDGAVNISDLVLVAGHLGELSGVSAAPSVPCTTQHWIRFGDDSGMDSTGHKQKTMVSFVFQHGIANLQRLLALLTPEKTALLANYPNPFNPETWITVSPRGTYRSPLYISLQ